MANSSQRVTSDGTLSTLAISIEYFDRAEISVLFDGIVTTTGWSWVGTSDKTLQFTPNVPNGVEVTIQRSSDITEIRHEFSLGAAFKAGTIDENFQQILHIAQEARENPVYTDIFNDVDMHGYKFKNLADGVAPTDSVNMQQHTAQAVIMQGLVDDATEAVVEAKQVVDNIANVVDPMGNLTVTKELKFTTTDARITGDFWTLPLRIKSNAGVPGSATTILVEPPTGGVGSVISLACNAAGTDKLDIYSDFAQGSIHARPDPTTGYGKVLQLMAGTDISTTRMIISPGNLTYEKGYWLTGDSANIYANWSDDNLYKRMLFKSSVAGGNTYIGAAPNGMGVQAGYIAYNSSDVPNASYVQLNVSSAAAELISGKTGTGAYLPLAMNVGGANVATYSEAAATLGNMTASVSRDSSLAYTISNANVGAGANAVLFLTSNAGSTYSVRNSTASGGGFYNITKSGSAYYGTSTGHGVVIQTNNVPALSVDATGNVLAVKATGGLGYGVGAGGTVTQTTSIGTAVTLNRPCGRIDLFNAAVSIGGIRQFLLINNLLTYGDGVKIDLGDLGHGDSGDGWVASTRIAGTTCVITLWNRIGVATAADFAVYFKIMKGSNS